MPQGSWQRQICKSRGNVVKEAPDTFDYIIVGAGSAGCVLANRLTASGRHRVLLLEAGGEDRNIWIHVPLGYGKLFTDAEVNWLYRPSRSPSSTTGAIIQPRGKVLGGSSSINGLLYIRGQRRGLRPLAPARQRRLELRRRAALFPPRRGPGARRGRVARRRRAARGVRRARAASAVRGVHRRRRSRRAYRATTISTAPTQEGAGYYQLTARNGRRWSTAVGYLRPARRRPNLHRRSPTRWRRASCSRAGARSASNTGAKATTRTARASGEVILAGGAFNSPQLLQLSGVGPARTCCVARHRRRRRHAGRRRQPAGPLPGRAAVSLHRADHHQRRDRQLPPAASRRACAIALFRKGLLTIGARLRRRLLPHRPGGRDARRAGAFHPVQRRHGRRDAASVPRLHRLGLPAAAGKPRHRPHQVGRSARAAPAIQPRYLSRPRRPRPDGRRA